MSRVRWGIMGSGRVCADFTSALNGIGASITAVGASSLLKAQQFAGSHGSIVDDVGK